MFQVLCSMFYIFQLMSGASSCAKIGDSYFSDVTGSIQDPIDVPGQCEVTEYYIQMAVLN